MRFGVRKLKVYVGVVALICAALAGLGRVAGQARHAALSRQCAGHFAQLGLAIHIFHEAYGQYPPAYISDASGRRVHSWRVLILPFIEEDALYIAYDLSEPWNGPTSRGLARRRPAPYTWPYGPHYGGSFQKGVRTSNSVVTNYLAVIRPGTAFLGGRSMSQADIRDETTRCPRSSSSKATIRTSTVWSRGTCRSRR